MKRTSKFHAWLSGALAMFLLLTIFPSWAITSISAADIGLAATSQYHYRDNHKFLEYPASKTTAQASQSQPGSNYTPSNMLDGNLNSKWEAPWSGGRPPYELVFTLQNSEYVSGFMYTSRQDKNTAGMMTQYKIYAAANDVFTDEPIAEGNFIARTATEFVYFDEPVLAKKIKIVSDASAVAEIRMGYIPSSANDYDTLLNELKAYRHDEVQSGEDKGLWRPAYLEQFDAALELIEDGGKPTEHIGLYEVNRTLVGLTSDLKRNQLAFTIDLAQKLKQAKTLFNSALPGTDPLKWPQSAIDAFQLVIDEAEMISESPAYALGEIEDMDKKLDYSTFVFKLMQHKPVMSFTGSTNQSLSYLLDGLTESHFQASGTGEGKYIMLDYKNPIRFENIAFQTWFATGQAVTQVKVQYLNDNDQWTWADQGKTYIMNWTTNTNVSETQKIIFDEAIRSHALRIHIMAARSAQYVIDELIPGIAVDVADLSVSLDKEALFMEEGEIAQLTAVVLPAYASNKNILWTSDHPATVSVDGNGVIRALKVPEGAESFTVNITATTEYGGKIAQSQVTIVPRKITEEDKKETLIRWHNAHKLANAPKTAEHYSQEDIIDFKASLAELEEKLANPYLTLGQLSNINGEILQATEAFEHTSKLPLIEIRNLIDRVTGPSSSERFEYEIIPKDAVTGMDVYEIDWKDGKPVLRGNNMVSLASAFNYYLKYYIYLDFPYVGDSRLHLPETLVSVPTKIRIVFPYQYRHYFNENCEYKYTTVLYGMMEWQHRLDWLAMNGFNMFLMDAGDYAVWDDAATKLGIADNAAAMKELRSSAKDTNNYMGQYTISEDAVQRDGEIARFITETAFKLGLEPEVRPFVGQVPFMFLNNRDQYYGNNPVSNITVNLPNSIFDGMLLYAGARWFNLPQGVFISPETAQNVPEQKKVEMKEKFTEIAQIYYESLLKITGFDDYGRVPKFGYKDLVGEQGFVVQHEAFPRKVLAEMSEEFSKINPDSIWMQTSWRYSKWLTEYYKPGRLMFVDLKAENRPLWKTSDEFAGTPWLWSVLLNFGGNTGMDAGLGTVADMVMDAKNNSHHMRGISIAPEGGDTNPAFYGFMAEMTWRSEAPDVDQWIKDYTKRRYGEANYAAAQQDIDQAWSVLLDTVYSDFLPKGVDGPSQTLINAAPKLTGALSRYYGSNVKLYQAHEIIPVWKSMLDAAQKMTDPTPQFLYDLVDITRQVLGDVSGDIYAQINPSFLAKNKENTLKYAQLMVDLAADMDEILATDKEFMLGTRLERARNRGSNDSDALYYEKSERTFLTFWIMDKPDSGGLLDYSNRHLSGLMTDYYGKRWEVFRDALMTALDNNTGLNQGMVNTTNRNHAVQFTEDRSIYPTVPQGNAIEISKRLYSEYESLFLELYGSSDSTHDLPLEGMSVTAGSENALSGNEGPARFVLDNNSNTMWHSKYAGDAYDNLWISVQLSTKQIVDGLRYLPRQGGGTNGIITEYAIDISEDGGQTYREVATGVWAPNNLWKVVSFKPVQATHVKLRVLKSESMSSLRFASASEIRILHTGAELEEEVDTTSPQWSSDAELKATEVKADSVLLNWSAATDDVGVTAYVVYQGEEELAVVTDGLSYQVSGLTAETAYTFTVVAEDSAKNRSEALSVSVTTAQATQEEEEEEEEVDTTSPQWSSDAELKATEIKADSVLLNWSAATDDVGVTAYVVYQGEEELAVVTDGLSYQVSGLTAETAYTFTVVAEDEAKNRSEALSVSITTAQATQEEEEEEVEEEEEEVDTTSPQWSSDAELKATEVKADSVLLNWSAATDDVGVTAYVVYQGEEELAVVTDELSYQVSGLTAETAYTFTVVAEDEAKNRSEALSVSITTAQATQEEEEEVDTTSPQWSSDAELKATQVGKNGVTLTWTAATDNKKVTSYILYKDGNVLASVSDSTLSYAVQELRPGTTYSFKVEAGDEAGNWSVDGPSVQLTTKREASNSDWTSSDDTNTTPEKEGNQQQPTDLGQPKEEEESSLVLSDISSHWAQAAIERAIKMGFVTGYADGTFKPNQHVTRAEFATLLAKALKLDKSDHESSFTDHDITPAWSTPFISAIVQKGFIIGYADGTFRPNMEITRTELAVIMVRALGIKVSDKVELGFADANEAPAWGLPYLAAAVEAGLMKGNGNGLLNPNGLATRAEAVTMLLHMLDQ